MDILTMTNLSFQNKIKYPNISVPDGSITFLQGPSGCGKTTLFHLLNNTLSPSSGEILFKGKSIFTMKPLELRQQILLVSQQAFLFEGTIKDNFEKFYTYRGAPVPDTNTMNFYLALAIVPFDAEKDITYLSGGERQRVFNAIMLSFDASVYLWDEPSSALDAKTAVAFFTNLRNYMKRYHKTSLVISHDESLYPVFSDHTIILQAPPNTTENARPITKDTAIVDLDTNPATNRPTSLATNCSTDSSTNRSTDLSTNRSTDSATNRAADHHEK